MGSQTQQLNNNNKHLLNAHYMPGTVPRETINKLSNKYIKLDTYKCHEEDKAG